MHQQGHTAVAHIDDLYLQGQTFKHVKNVIDTTALFDKLGVLVNPDKSVFIPTQVITILGFVINSMTVQLTREKATGLKRSCAKLLADSSPSIREVSSVIGRIVFSFPGVVHGIHYYWHHKFQADKGHAMHTM